MIGRATTVSPPAFERTSTISPRVLRSATSARSKAGTTPRSGAKVEIAISPISLRTRFHSTASRAGVAPAGRQDRFAIGSSNEELVARIVTACDGAGERPLVGSRVGTRQEARSAGLVQLGYWHPINRHKFIARPNARALRQRTPLYCCHDVAAASCSAFSAEARASAAATSMSCALADLVTGPGVGDRTDRRLGPERSGRVREPPGRSGALVAHPGPGRRDDAAARAGRSSGSWVRSVP